jgi:hypothetical protein
MCSFVEYLAETRTGVPEPNNVITDVTVNNMVAALEIAIRQYTNQQYNKSQNERTMGCI